MVCTRESYVCTRGLARGLGSSGRTRRTICRAAMQTVLTENLRPHISNKSSSDGPSKSMTRILCSPSCPKWYIWGIPAAQRKDEVRRRRTQNCHRYKDTYHILREYDTNDTRLGAVVPLPSAVPAAIKSEPAWLSSLALMTHKLDSHGLLVKQVYA